MTQKESSVLMEMATQLGRIESNVTNIQSDIMELKQKDVEGATRLDAMYEKAMNYASKRQDSIRDMLQTQITANTNAIAELKGAKGKRLTKWYDQVVDKVIWVAVAVVGALIAKWAMGGFKI